MSMPVVTNTSFLQPLRKVVDTHDLPYDRYDQTNQNKKQYVVEKVYVYLCRNTCFGIFSSLACCTLSRSFYRLLRRAGSFRSSVSRLIRHGRLSLRIRTLGRHLFRISINRCSVSLSESGAVD